MSSLVRLVPGARWLVGLCWLCGVAPWLLANELSATQVETELAALQRLLSVAVVTQSSQPGLGGVDQDVAQQLQQRGLALWASAPNQQVRALVQEQLLGWGLLGQLPGWNPSASLPRFGAPTLPSYPARPQIEGDPNLDKLQRPYVVHFWADWCGPCREELPALAQFYAEQYLSLEAAGIGLVTVNNDPSFDPKQHPNPSVQLRQLPVLHDPEFRLYRRLAQRHGVALPATFLLQPDRSSRALAYGPMEWLEPGVAQQLLALAVKR